MSIGRIIISSDVERGGYIGLVVEVGRTVVDSPSASHCLVKKWDLIKRHKERKKYLCQGSRRDGLEP